MGWYVDGEWKVEGGVLSFLQFKDKSGLATNNLVMKSSRIEFFWNFRVDYQAPNPPKSNPRIPENEVLAWSISPEIYDIKSFDSQQTVMHANGLVIFMYRAKDGRSVISLKEFPTPVMYNLREIFLWNVAVDGRTTCLHTYLNQNTQFNFTMDFEMATMKLYVNGNPCLETKIPQNIFPVRRATTTFFGYSSENAPISIKFEEISIYKAVNLLTSRDAAFTNSVHGLIQTVKSYDPMHFKNASLSNIMLLDVK